MKLPHHRKNIHGIFARFPIFFPQRCDCCGYDFVRESMWSFDTGPWERGLVSYPQGVRHYLCKECVPTKKMAHDYANKYNLNRIIDPPKIP